MSLLPWTDDHELAQVAGAVLPRIVGYACTDLLPAANDDPVTLEVRGGGRGAGGRRRSAARGVKGGTREREERAKRERVMS
jgi:hypothetical protein